MTSDRITPTMQREAQRQFMARVAVETAAHQHLWTAIAHYTLASEHLDSLDQDHGTSMPALRPHNLNGVHLTCYICEIPYRPVDRETRCPGDPHREIR